MLELLESIEISADVIDLRTLQPLDTSTIFASVQKTGRVLIVHEDSLFGGIGSDISALISENCFESLDAPIMRIGSLETPIPFTKNLEKNYLPKDRIKEKLESLLQF